MPASSARWSRRPPGSNWGDFGADDQLGRLNLITAETVLRAAHEIKLGRSFCLSLPLDYPGDAALNPFRAPPKLTPETLPDGRVAFNAEAGTHVEGATDVFSDARAALSLQYSTHWDGLAHVGQKFDLNGDGRDEIAYYNGYNPATGNGTDTVAGSLGIDTMATASVQGRGVMLDIEAHFGLVDTLIGYEELMRVIDADALEIEEGDFVCVRTGYAKMLLRMNHRPDKGKLERSTAALDGRDERLLQWITDTGIVAIAADNYAVERLPARKGSQPCCASLPLHEHCLFRLGVYLGELWYLSDLADCLRENNRSSFFLTAPPLRLPGAVASPVTPIATI